MSVRGAGDTSTLRRALVLALSLGLLVLGGGLSLTVPAVDLAAPFDLPVVALAALLGCTYVAAARRPLDFEFGKDVSSITLTQLPLAFGVLLLAPWLHFTVRMVAVLVDNTLRRHGPTKMLFNVGAAAAEVGIAAAAVAVVADVSRPGPALSAALLAGIVLGDVVSNLALQVLLTVLGRRPSWTELVHHIRVLFVTSTIFTAVAVVALSAAWTDAWTILVTLGLSTGLALAYRGHRRQSAREQTTQRLYTFVKQLQPVAVDDDDAVAVLHQVRDLLRSRHLHLAICSPGEVGWRHVVVSDTDVPSSELGELHSVADQVASTWTPSLDGRGRVGDSQRMTTPLLGSDGLIGVLTAHDRLGTVRGFDLGDLRLLETIGAELATSFERGRLLADLGRAATTDPLTTLPNLNETSRRLAEMLDRHAAGVVLAAVAVDSFREVNDTLGHEVGDELLLEVTARLLRAMPDAVVGRIGGGRFAVAVPALQAGGDPELFGLGIRAQVEGNAQIGAVGTHVKLSVGVVRAPEHGDDAATLVRRAETAMYSARHANGGPVLWEPAYEVRGQRKLAVVSALREAIACGAIGVAYQPKVEMTSGHVTGVEALARWTHPALGAISPDEFVPLAEASGLMGPMTASVLRQSLTACKGWQRRAADVGVSVNVSADTVLDASFVTEVAAVLTSVGIAPELLTLELTESVLLHDPVLAVERMGELRALGIKLSVDDFGTGYSSLTYLKGLPVDEVKIDKGFVDGLEHDPADRAVVRAVVDIAHTLGLKVVAEGVEQEAQQGILRALGVDEVQGYLHARPMPALETAVWLRRQTELKTLA